MKPLFEMSNEYLRLMHELEELQEITDDDLAKIALIESDIQSKTINIGLIIKSFEVEYQAVFDNIAKQNERLKKVSRKIERLKNYLKFELERMELKEVKNHEVEIKIKLNPGSVEVIDEKLIPQNYFNEKVTTLINKALLLQELKKNIQIPGVMLKKENRIEIR